MESDEEVWQKLISLGRVCGCKNCKLCLASFLEDVKDSYLSFDHWKQHLINEYKEKTI